MVEIDVNGQGSLNEEVRYRGGRADREGRDTKRNVETTDEDVGYVRTPRERVVGRVVDGNGSDHGRTGGGGHVVSREPEEGDRLRGLSWGSSSRSGRVENRHRGGTR